MDEVLSVRVDSKASQVDLEAFGRALDQAEAKFERFNRSVAGASDKLDRSLTKAARSMGQFAEVTSLLNRMRGVQEPSKKIIALSQAIDALGRARMIKRDQLKNFADFVSVAARAQQLRIGNSFATGIHAMADAMNAVAATRSITRSKLKGFVDFIEIAARAQRLRFDPRAAQGMMAVAAGLNAIGQVRGLTATKVANVRGFFDALNRFSRVPDMSGLGRLMQVLGRIRVPTNSAIGRLERLFTVLQGSKRIAGAAQISRDLDMIAASASRAADAINRLPARLRGLGSQTGNASRNFMQAANSADKFNDQLRHLGPNARRARMGVVGLSSSMNHLNMRLNLGYQAGTLFTAMFSAFTLGAFIREVYRANIEVMKLEKAMLFATGTFAEASQATAEFMGMAQELGLRIADVAEPYSRFAISARASGLELEQINTVFSNISTALLVVGASSQQTELAFYGLTQMMQKGRVSSEEFNRQIGEQIPGNAIAGARALSRLEGQMVSVGEFYERMRRGEIMSADFAPAWAEELSRMFSPLLEVAKQRPDIALNRLVNAFFLFNRAVGENGFMSEIGNQFNRLSDLLIEGEGDSIRLTESAQHLAETLGTNLANMASLAGDAIAFLLENIDGVVIALKALAGATVLSTLQGMTRGFLGMAAAAAAVPRGMMGAVLGSGRATTAGAAAAATGHLDDAIMAGTGGTMTGIMAERNARGVGRGQGEPGRPRGAAQAGGFGRRSAGALVAGGTFDARRTQTATRSLLSMGSAARVARVGLAALALGIPLVGAAAAGAVVAMMALSSEQTRLGERSVTFGSILTGTFDYIKDGIGNWWASVSENFTLFGSSIDEMKAGAGEFVVSMIAGFVYLARQIGHIVGGIGNHLKILFESSLGPIAEVVMAMMRGDWEAAGSAVQRGADNARMMPTRILDNAGNMLSNMTQESYSDIRSGLVSSINAAEDNRLADDQRRVNDENAQAARRQIEAALAQEQAAQDQMQAAADLLEASRGMVDFNLNSGELLDQARSQASGEWLRSQMEEAARRSAMINGTGGASAAPAGAGRLELRRDTGPTSSSGGADVNEAVLTAISRAAMDHNLREGTLRAIAQAESSMNPLAANPLSSARGLFQFTEGTWSDYGQGPLSQRMDPVAASQAAARMLAANEQALSDRTGRARGSFSDGELYATHFLGLSGASRVIEAPRNAAVSEYVNQSAINANPGVFNDENMTVGDFLDELEGRMSRGRADASPAQSGMTSRQRTLGEDERERLNERGFNSIASMQAIVSYGNPAAQAMARLRREQERLTDALEFDRDYLEQTGGPSIFNDENIAQLERGLGRLEEEVRRAMDPIGTLNAETERAIEIEQLRSRGLADQASYQEEINRLIEQGYRLEEIHNETTQRAYTINQQRLRQLEDETELRSTLRDMEVNSVRRSGTARDVAMASALADRAQGSESLAQTRARLQAEGRLGTVTQAVDAVEGSRRQDEVTNLNRQLQELMASRGMNTMERSIQESYRSALQSLTGSTAVAISELEAQASAADRAMARSFADTKYELENPPGFQRWVDGLEPVAERLQDIKATFAQDLSQTLTDVIAGDDVDVGAMFERARRSMIQANVESLMGRGFERVQGMAQEGGILGRLFGGSSGSAASAGGGRGGLSGLLNGMLGGEGDASTSTNAMTVQAGTVYINGSVQGGGMGGAGDILGAVMGGGAKGGGMGGAGDILGAVMGGGARGGGVKSLADAVMGGGAKGGGAKGLAKAVMGSSGALSKAGAAGGGGFLSSMGGMLGDFGPLGLLAALGNLGGGSEGAGAEPSYSMPAGIIGQMSSHNMSGTAKAAKSNPIAQAIGFAADMFTGGAYSTYAGIGNMFAGFFKEGGISTSPVSRAAVPIATFRNVPHFSEGTANTSGAIPAMLHPDEAVIPLSRGRKVPVEMNGGGSGQGIVMNSHYTIVAPDPDAFRKSSGAIQRDQNRKMKRASLRNLNA